MANLKAVIFDYYETLAALPAAPRERVFDQLARRVGAELPPGEAYRDWRERIANDRAVRFGGQRPPLDGPTPPFRSFRQTWLERFEQLFRLWAVDVPAALGADAYAGAHADALAYPDARAALDTLRHRYRLAVLSDADNDFLHAGLRRNGFAFEAVVTSEEVRAFKPHVSMFREVCAQLGVAADEAMYVGDGPWPDVAGARHAGLRAVWAQPPRRGVAGRHRTAGDARNLAYRVGRAVDLAALRNTPLHLPTFRSHLLPICAKLSSDVQKTRTLPTDLRGLSTADARRGEQPRARVPGCRG